MPPYHLIIGGFNGVNYPQVSHIFDGSLLSPVFSSTLPADALQTPRLAHHQTIYVPQWNSVYIIGGENGAQTFSTIHSINLDNVILLNAGALKKARSHHSASLLTNGCVIIIGGATQVTRGQPEQPLSSVERYDPASGTSTEINPMKTARYGHQAVHLSDNTVIICGGQGVGGKILSDCETLVY